MIEVLAETASPVVEGFGRVADSLGELPWHWVATLRLIVAAGLGGLIGAEREVHGREAGLRTQMLVALGAALAMVVSLNFAVEFGKTTTMPNLQIDPARLAYSVMAGVGFLGAGAVIHYRTTVRGLTTAASVWCSAAVGLAAGFGMYIEATAAALMALFVLAIVRRLDGRLPQRRHKTLTVTVAGPPERALERLRAFVRSRDFRIHGMRVERNTAADTTTVRLELSSPSDGKFEPLLSVEQAEPAVRSFKLS